MVDQTSELVSSMSDKHAAGDDTRVLDAIERLKKHPVLSVAIYLSLLTGTAAGLWNAIASGGDFVSDLANSYREQ